MGLVDTHCHLQSPAFDNDRRDVLARALAALDWIVVVGDDIASSEAACESAGDRVYATVGIHPHNADVATPENLQQIRDLAVHPCLPTGRPRVVAIGEVGLDYHYEHSRPRTVQIQALERQLELAAETALPVVIHCRDAYDDMAAVLDKHAPRLSGGVMHCFSGDTEFAERCVGLGLFISFAGNVTFPNADRLREAARNVPLERLLVETDSPYLAPQPVRGKRCEPLHVTHTARCIAELKDVDHAQFADTTTDNAARAFHLEPRTNNQEGED